MEGRKRETKKQRDEGRKEGMNEGWPPGMKKERQIKTTLTEDLGV
jgi:hypothetical protein